ncbi:MAG: hypothetical protein IKB51_03900 [Clostridia bacterium]|nr:hypothetical protein [Clostridia bacterium]
MLWFGKKKKKEAENEAVDIIEESTEVEEKLDLDDDVEVVSEDEILESLNENDEADLDTDGDEELDEGFDDEDDENDDNSASDVLTPITSLDMLVDYVNGKPIGAVQFMRKENNEVFELREVYFRIARVWGSVSMAREYTPAEYARIMLAAELFEEPDKFYVLPILTDEEREQAIFDFCEEKYGENGKRYVKNTDKFARLVNANGDKEEWLAYTKEIITEKITDFCRENGISFDCCQKDANEQNALTEVEADE